MYYYSLCILHVGEYVVTVLVNSGSVQITTALLVQLFSAGVHLIMYNTIVGITFRKVLKGLHHENVITLHL